jgi:biopolymer transport protein ExbD
MKELGSYFVVDRPRLEIIPMIDIMMFLLVFFIVLTLRMISGTGIQLDLPTSRTTQELKPSVVAIGVRKNGTMVVDEREIDAPALKSKLEGAQKSNKVSVTIAGDKEVSLQTLLGVMDIVRSVGISAVGIAARGDIAGTSSTTR